MYCDLEFEVGTNKRKFTAHLALIIARCPYFKTVLKETVSDSDRLYNIKLPDVDNKFFELILRYFYTDELYLPNEISVDEVFQYLDIVDSFKLNRIVEFCKLEICGRLKVENVIIALKKGAKIPQIKSACLQFVMKSYDAVISRDEFCEVENSIIVEIMRIHRGLKEIELFPTLIVPKSTLSLDLDSMRQDPQHYDFFSKQVTATLEFIFLCLLQDVNILWEVFLR